jgi:transcriptional regulator with XRE-family HTH domain
MRYDIIVGVIIMFNRIRNLREDKDLTQKKLSTILHCSQQVYSNYELGQRDIPTDILIRLARFYGTSIDYLLGETDRKEPYPKK